MDVSPRDDAGPGKGVAAVAGHLAESARTLLRRRRRVDDLLARTLPDAGGARAPLVVGVDGRSGSGKTLLAHALALELRARLREDGSDGADGAAHAGASEDPLVDLVEVLALEDLYHGWDGLEAGLETARGLLEPLSRGEVGRAPRWDWHAGRHDGEVSVGHLEPSSGAVRLPAVVVVEGCGAGSDVLAPLVDMLVWVEVPESTRRARVRSRDGAWGYPWEAWAAQEEAVLARRDAAEAADLVVGTAPRPGGGTAPRPGGGTAPGPRGGDRPG